MVGPEGSSEGAQKSSDKEKSREEIVDEINIIFDDFIFEIQLSKDDSNALPQNISVQRGELRRRDWEVKEFEKMEKRAEHVRNKVLEIYGIKPPEAVKPELPQSELQLPQAE